MHRHLLGKEEVCKDMKEKGKGMCGMGVFGGSWQV